MKNEVTLSVSELQELLNYGLEGFLDHTIETKNDYYWKVLYSEMFDFPEAPILAVGSLDDDLKHLRSFLNESVPFGETEIGRLAAILKLLANHLEADEN